MNKKQYTVDTIEELINKTRQKCTNPKCHNLAEPNHNWCAKCIVRYRNYMRKRAQKLRKARLCVICGTKSAKPERTTCEACLARHYKERARLYRERQTRNLCPICGLPLLKLGSKTSLSHVYCQRRKDIICI